jgi:hypothetical protein
MLLLGFQVTIFHDREKWKENSGCIENNGNWELEDVSDIKKVINNYINTVWNDNSKNYNIS